MQNKKKEDGVGKTNERIEREREREQAKIHVSCLQSKDMRKRMWG